MARPIEQIVKQCLFFCYQCIKFIDHDDLDLFCLFLCLITKLFIMVVVAVLHLEQELAAVFLFEVLIQEEGCSGGVHSSACNVLTDDCVDEVWVRYLHCVDVQKPKVLLFFQLLNDFQSSCSLARAWHSTNIKRGTRTFIPETTCNVINNKLALFLSARQNIWDRAK